MRSRSGSSSPSYSPPRDRSRTRRGVSPPRRYRSRSRSNGRAGSRFRRSKSPSPLSTKPATGPRFPWEDRETLSSLHCQDCNVGLHDKDSMLAHLRGRPHLMQKQRLHESRVRQATGLALGLTEALVPDKEKLQYDDKFWDRQRGGVRLRPEQEKFLDTTRYDRMEAKFKKDRYDGGQFRFSEEELHCKDCNVWTRYE